MALSRAALRGPRSAQAKALIEPIEAALGGKVALQGSRFYLLREDGAMEAHLVAEGLRKIASLAQLVLNGSLTTNGLLFWDEPEANLNPRLVSLVVDLLLELGKRGVQIFVTTHDYLLAHKLSLLAEYGKHPEVPIRFFAFHRKDGKGPVLVDRGDTLAGLPDNPILEEFERHYDFGTSEGASPCPAKRRSPGSTPRCGEPAEPWRSVEVCPGGIAAAARAAPPGRRPTGRW